MKKNDIRTLTRLALLVAIALVMKAVGLGSVPVGPLYMSFLTLPIAVGAITMGPAAGAILGGVFGAVSFYDAVTGASAMTGALFLMGYIVLAFYGCDYVQNLVSVKGAANPLMFVVLLVGVQGVAEFLVSGILGGLVARAVHKFLK